MIIFDLDGTLSLTEHRQHLVQGVPGKMYSTAAPFIPDWDAFFSACVDDLPNKPVIDVFHKLKPTCHIEIWSGRSDKVRHETVQWLKRNIAGHLADVNLRMREEGDFTPDDELKYSWMKNHIVNGGDINYVFDDRDKVVAMWRENGITCFQVAPGAF